MRAKQFLNEDWNKVNHHDKTDGLSQKAVNAYRREHPGSKLQTAVTTKPSKLKAGSKDAKRRKSFCARMSGNKGPMKDEKGRPTPKAKALARWNCEESIQQLEQQLDEIKKGQKDSNGFTKCWPGKHAEGTKKGKNGKPVRNCVPNESVTEDAIGTAPKRPAREGSRPARGHKAEPRYKTTGISKDKEDQFHLKLDKLVHGTFGNSPDEVKEGHDEFADKDLDYLQGYYSDFHKDLHGFRPRHHSEEEWNDPETIKKLIHGLHDHMDRLKQSPEGRAQLKADGWQIDEGWFDSKPKVDFKARAKELFAKGLTEQQVLQQLIKEGCPPNQAAVFVQGAQLEEGKTVKQEAPKPRNFVAKNAINTGAGAHKDKKKAAKQGEEKHKKNAMDLAEVADWLEEEKAERKLCLSSKPDNELGASNLASCKSQGLRARDGNKSHKLGKAQKSRVKVGGHKIKGNKYGGPLPDWS